MGNRCNAALSLALLLAGSLEAQTTGPSSAESLDESALEVPQEVNVDPVAEDTDIADRLTRIMQATEWFDEPSASVDEGVVFLRGAVHSEQHKEWAGRLAGKTQGVVAVVNRIEVIEKSMWDFSPAWSELEQFTADTVRNSPLIALGLLLLGATWFVAKWSTMVARTLFSTQFKSQLLRDVAARAIAIPVFLLGLYVVLRISGLTRLAMTVLGGTGLVGLVVGFAFRDIAENFLASVLISIQHPFARGDWIQVEGYEGYVQSVNTRSTLLMTLDGNYVQIPNATIYKSTITNYTANPNSRFEINVGIGYDDSIEQAQSAALETIKAHPAVIARPEPTVLVESLGASTVNLRIFFWVNIEQHSHLKVRSAVTRQIKVAFDKAGISMPDEAREVVFPSGVPVMMVSETEPAKGAKAEEQVSVAPSGRAEGEPESTESEGDLTSEATDIKLQADNARKPEGGEDLLP